MAWNYRKRVKIAPGVHINFSKNGISTSIGPKGAKISFGKNGTYLNTGIPGTGLYSRQKISGNKGISSYTTNTNSNNSGCTGCLIFICIMLFFLGCIFISTLDSTALLIGVTFIGISIIVFYKSVCSKKDEKTESSQLETKKEDCSNNNTQNSLPTESSLDKQTEFSNIFDPFLDEAVRAILQAETASTSLIQRRFAIGYNRAGHIMDQLERIGVVGPACGSAPRELLIHNTDEWLILKSRFLQEYGENKTKDESSTSNTSLFHSLTEEQFNLIKTASDNLCSFMIKVCRKKNMRVKLSEMLEIENSDGTPWEISQKVKLAIFTDVYRCYKGLGHDFFTDDDNENIGIYLFIGKYLKPDINLTFNTVPIYKKTLKKPVTDLLKTSELLNQNSKMASNEFILQKALGECDRDLQIQYMSLLYRFASTVAKADGQVNETEEKWLADLMKSKELNIGNGSNIKTTTNQEQKSIESPYDMLNDLIGLTSVKEEITKLANFIKIQQIRDSKGLKTPDISYHCVFTGNPGTGKTTVARIMASIYKELGIFKKGHLVETDRSGLVAEYVGQTAVKTNKIIDSALDGVLFIDEAYSLIQGAKEDYGQEAISTLLKRMEDDRNRLVVILAGYSSEMKAFIDSNPGLQSRFNRYIHFPDYTADELKQIFLLNTKKNQYTIDEEALTVLDEMMTSAIEHKDKNFGNARFVRNIFEKSIQNQAMRLSSQSNITEDILSKLKAEDLSNIK